MQRVDDILSTVKPHFSEASDKPGTSLSVPHGGSLARSGTSTRHSPSHSDDIADHNARCLHLFNRLSALYRHRAGEFQPHLPDGSPTPEFRLWCQKLRGLTAAQFRQGLELLERQEADGRRTGDETWPPSYSGFIGLATMSLKPRSTVSPPPTNPVPRDVARQKLAAILETIA